MRYKNFLKRLFRGTWSFVLFFLAAIVSKFLFWNRKKHDIWIITERTNECKDNGYHFFKYMRENYPERNVFYAIDKGSPQRERIEKYGNILDHNSFRHYVYTFAATRLIGAQYPGGMPASASVHYLRDFAKGKKVFLQHGIIKEMISFYVYRNTKADLFICGAKPEYDYVKAAYGYPPENVQYTGLCRYDALNEFTTEKFVLLMPTWRRWIPSAVYHPNGWADPNDYEYFLRYKSLINNSELREQLRANGYRLLFHVHHEMQPYMDFFGASDDVVTLATEDKYDVQELMKSCACMITDYSSVQFDVAYMQKPLIYYQFDEEKYYKDHLQKGYYDYETMAFGPKCGTEQEVVDALRECFAEKMVMTEKYRERTEKFFLYRDTENCKRVYEAIERL